MNSIAVCVGYGVMVWMGFLYHMIVPLVLTLWTILPLLSCSVAFVSVGASKYDWYFSV